MTAAGNRDAIFDVAKLVVTSTSLPKVHHLVALHDSSSAIMITIFVLDYKVDYPSTE